MKNLTRFEKIKRLWIWNFFRSGIPVIFVLFFGFFATLAYISEKKKNEKFSGGKHIMQEEIIYIRPVGFEEKEPNDTTKVEINDTVS